MDTIYAYDSQDGHIVWLDSGRRVVLAFDGTRWHVCIIIVHDVDEYMHDFRTFNSYGRR